MDIINNYINKLNDAYRLGNATEHTYRKYLQDLIEGIIPGITATNEPRRINCGAPDYIITKKGIPIGYIEAKDIGRLGGLNATEKKQFKRYIQSLDNLIYTDYIDFIFYKNAEEIARISIAEVSENTIKPLPQKFATFENLLREFCTYTGTTIKSANKLATMMANKAKIMSDVIAKALESDKETVANSTIKDQLEAFRQILIHDIKPAEFADVYAQTIAYGMFAARLHDETLENFSRQEAAELIPRTNPFLRNLFSYIAGPDIDDRIKWVVDELANVFSFSNVAKIMEDYGKETRTTDPVIHFYETFLAEYNPALRKARGVWYTPKPVVQFIVRALDDILKTEFNLPMGLADTSKAKVKVNIDQSTDRRTKTGKAQIEKELHRVQILDPATGTGTFLAEVIQNIHKNFQGQEGIWSKYVDEHLIPRIHGFEILMASYAMAHLKLDMVLKDTGYKTEAAKRLQVYLTNSLEEAHPDTGTLFASWLSQEASEANFIKRDMPVMVVLGNPPYSVSSSNKGEWIQNLIKVYKKDLNEKKLNLDDDYIKFLRYAHHYIDKNGQGVIGMVTNNSFIDGITHRQMRKTLLEDFDKIYIIDLHGNAKKKETAPDGSKDENVFDIMQGVSINLFVKTTESKKNATVYHMDLYGKRKSKYEALQGNDLKSIKWNKLETPEPYHFFVPKDFGAQEEYEKGFKVDELFTINSSGIETQTDSLAIQFTQKKMEQVVEDLRQRYKELKKDGRDWRLDFVKKDLERQGNYLKVYYRPFDKRYTFYTGNSKGLVAYPRDEVMKNMISDNYGLVTCKRQTSSYFKHILVSNGISERCYVSLQTGEVGYLFPLYLYSDEDEMDQTRRPNLNSKIVEELADKIGLIFTSEETDDKNTFAPIDVLDYIYGVLHSPSYRDKYKEFLKIDFPRLPYPKDAKSFFAIGKIGSELRQLHLMEHSALSKLITKYPMDGDNIVDKPRFEDGKVYVNAKQYFDGVPEEVWNFYIGGYQVAHKWLKDRKGRELNFDDILHYQKIIVALSETIRLMSEVDKIYLNSLK